MTLGYSLKTAFRGLATNRTRSILTLLGIVIGIAAITLVMAVGRGAQDLILSQIQGLGSRTIVAVPGRQPSGPSDVAQIFSDSLKPKDLDALRRRENVPAAEEIMPVVFGGETASYGNETYRLTIFGASELIAKIFDLYPETGTFFSEDDIRGRADVIVIGAKVREELFGASLALGQRIKIKDRNFRIIGILPKKGQVSFFNFDEMAIVPYTTAQQYIFGIKHFHRFIIQADAEENIQRTVRDVELTLRQSHDITDPEKDDFFVETQSDLTARLGTITTVLTILLASIAAISLVVGGIGIMNITLV
ncbi:MAG: ABC transporter permease, partial [Patescibacteria group bacterium]